MTSMQIKKIIRIKKKKLKSCKQPIGFVENLTTLISGFLLIIYNSFTYLEKNKLA